MELLGVTLPPSLEAFYHEVAALFAADGKPLVARRGPGPEFGGFYVEDDQAIVALRHDLPPDALLHALGHELAHGLQRREGWPRVEANMAVRPDPANVEIAATLQALVHCSGAELRIAPLGLDPAWQQAQRHAVIRSLLRAPDPAASRRGTSAWAYWSLLHAYVGLLHPEQHTRVLLKNIERALPQAAAAGREAATLVRRRGWATRDQALASLRTVRDALDLGGMVVVGDADALDG